MTAFLAKLVIDPAKREKFENAQTKMMKLQNSHRAPHQRGGGYGPGDER